MGWISDTSEAIRAHTRAEPIQCPRAWGEVAFVSSVWCVPPLFGVDRRCPIAGVADCNACAHPSNPDAFRLGEQLDELERLLADGRLSVAEHAARRRAVVRLVEGSHARARWQRTAAWVITPLGGFVTVAGVVLATQVHGGFWGLAGGGAAAVVLGLSFWGLARSEASRSDSA